MIFDIIYDGVFIHPNIKTMQNMILVNMLSTMNIVCVNTLKIIFIFIF